MSAAAILALIAGAILLGLVLGLILRWDSEQPETEQIADAAQKQIWEERAKKAREDFGLAATRAVAGKWAASIGVILGALATVAVVAGPDALEEIGGTEAIVAAGLVLLAAAFAVVALLLAALAEQGSPVEADQLDGQTYRTRTRTRAQKAAKQIRASRVLTVLALLTLVSAAGVAWLAALTDNDPEDQSALVVSASGSECGALSQAGGVLMLTVSGKSRAIPGDARVTLVDSCPK